MHTARLSTVLASIATRCQHLVGGPQVKKFEQASSLGHQMIPPDAPCTVRRSHVGGGGWGSSWGWGARQGCPSTTVRSHVGGGGFGSQAGGGGQGRGVPLQRWGPMLVVGLGPGSSCTVQWGPIFEGGLCMVMSNPLSVMVTWDTLPPDRMTDRHDWNITFPQLRCRVAKMIAKTTKLITNMRCSFL